MKANISLKDGIDLTVEVNGNPVTVNLDASSSAEGYQKSQQYTQIIMERASKLSECTDDAKRTAIAQEIIEAIRFWFVHAAGEDAYNRIFDTPSRRANYPWHEYLYLSAMARIAECRNGVLQHAANSPLMRDLRASAMQVIASTTGVAGQ